jgi:hypothetical protein
MNLCQTFQQFCQRRRSISLANLHLRFTAISNTHFIAYGAADVATLAAQKSKAEDKYADQSLF